MAIFSFEFDGNPVSNPTNWGDVKIKYKRDAIIRGLFTQYTSELIFVNDAYDYLWNSFITDPCSKITCDIYYQCSSFDAPTLLFQGEISARALVFDKAKCLAKAVIEQTEISQLFADHKSKEVNFNLYTPADYDEKFLGPWTIFKNQNLAPGYAKIWPYLVAGGIGGIFEPVTGTFINNDCGGITTLGAFQWIVHAITDNRAAFYSDFFSTNQQDKWIDVVVDTTGMVAGQDLYMEFIDMFGHTHKITTEYDGVPANLATSHARNSVTTNGTVIPCMRLGEPFNIATAVVGNVITFTYKFHFDADLVNVTAGGGSATSSVVQEYIRGGNSVVATGKSLLYAGLSDFALNPSYLQVASDFVLNISFDALFEKLNKIWNLGMSFELIGGNWYIRVENIEYFYGSLSSVSLTNLKNVTIQFDQEQINGAANVGNVSDKENPYVYTTAIGPYEPTETAYSYKTDAFECRSFWDLKNDNDFYSGPGEKIASHCSGQQDYSDDVFIIEIQTDPTLIGTKAIREYFYDYFDIGGGIFAAAYYYNIQMKPDASLYYWMWNLPDMIYTEYENFHDKNIGFPNTLVQTTTTATMETRGGFRPRIYKFETRMTKDDFDNLSGAQQLTINETNIPAQAKIAYINELEYRISDGFAKFEVLTEN